MIDIRDSADIYLEHFNEAERLLSLIEPDNVADAQAHATLAAAAAITRLVDSYNGWKDLGP